MTHPTRPAPDRSPGRRAAALLLLALALALPGCGMIPWLAHGVAGGEQTAKVEAEYLDLANRSVAVFVAADERTLFAYPQAPATVGRAVSSALAQHVPGITLMNPEEVVAFQRQNPYWTTQRYSELIETLGVERLVLIDLIEYRTHEPGNAHVWQGVASGHVKVIEAQSDDPDNPGYAKTVRVQFPEESKIGLLNSDNQTVQLGLVTLFARQASGLFYDHEVKQ